MQKHNNSEQITQKTKLVMMFFENTQLKFNVDVDVDDLIVVDVVQFHE